MSTDPRPLMQDFRKSNRRRTTIDFDPEKEGRTEQQHVKACDINTIMAKYQKTGVIDHVNKYAARYGDIEPITFFDAQNIVADAKTQFEELPAYIRDQFENDVGQYLELMTTDEGVDQLKKMLHPAERYEDDGSPERPETPPEAPEAPETPSGDGDT